jgi:hypothetical protein
MSSFFSNPFHASIFSYGFDLLSDGDDDINFLDIVSELENFIGDNSDDISEDEENLSLALDAVYIATGCVDDAILYLSTDHLLTEYSYFQLRRANHHFLKGEKEEGEKCLQSIILMENPTDIVKRICALIAVGILGDEFSLRRDGIVSGVTERIKQVSMRTVWVEIKGWQVFLHTSRFMNRSRVLISLKSMIW